MLAFRTSVLGAFKTKGVKINPRDDVPSYGTARNAPASNSSYDASHAAEAISSGQLRSLLSHFWLRTDPARRNRERLPEYRRENSPLSFSENHSSTLPAHEGEKG
jgi:hypothetical protein